MSAKKRTVARQRVVETFEEYIGKESGLTDDLILDDIMFEMATFRPVDTGLLYSVWISTKEGRQHDVRVKVSHNPHFPQNETAIITLRPEIRWVTGMRLNSKDFRLAKLWIELNYDTIIAFWNQEIVYTADLLAAIKRLNS